MSNMSSTQQTFVKDGKGQASLPGLDLERLFLKEFQ